MEDVDIDMAEAEPSPSIIRLPTPSPPAVVYPQSYDAHRSQHTPLVIDNGSTTLRYGFSSAIDPFEGPNVVAKYKERKYNRPLLLFGDAIDAESGAKGQARTPWEGDVLLNFDALVCSPLYLSPARHNETVTLTSRDRKTPWIMCLYSLELMRHRWTIRCSCLSAWRLRCTRERVRYFNLMLVRGISQGQNSDFRAHV